MNKNELKRLKWLHNEIEQLEQELKEVHSKGICSISFDGMPRSMHISDRTGNQAVKAVALEKQLIEMQRQYKLEEKKICDYIISIDDFFIRKIFILRYVNSLPWHTIAGRLGSSPDSLRMLHNRYLSKH